MSRLINDINREFRALLEQHENPAKVYQELSRGMTERGCTFAAGPMPIYVKPYFIDGKRMPYIRHTTEVIVRVLNKVTDLYYTRNDLKPLFEMSEIEQEICSIDQGYKDRVKITRNDAFMTDDYLLYVEFNADSPGGPMYTDVQGDLIMENDVMKTLMKKHDIRRDMIMPQVLKTLLDSYREWGGNKEKPVIVISGGKGGGTTPEFLAIVEWLKTLGFKSTFCSTTEWSYDGKRLLSPDGVEPDIIYRRGWIGDFINNMEECKPVLRALRQRKVCMVNPLNSILGSQKSLLAVLQQDAIFNLLDAEEKKVIRETIPWTRVMRQGKTLFHDREIDLYETVRKNQQQFVLKPIDQYGGKDVIVGNVTALTEWEGWVDKTLKSRFIVQEYVQIPEEELPTFEPDLRFSAKKVNVNFYAYGGIYTGGVVRSSDSPVINVHKGGGMTPIMYVNS